MPAGRDDDAIERALEQLLRLNASRKVHARQVAAAGVRISAPGLALLRRIQEEGPLSLGELARRTEMDPAATGRQIRALEDEGFVRRGARHAVASVRWWAPTWRACWLRGRRGTGPTWLGS